MTNRIAPSEQKGQTMPEFAIVLGMITVAIVTTISLLSDAALRMFENAVDVISQLA